MGGSLPKQFLPLKGQPIALYSLKVFLDIEEIEEIVVVCAPQYRSFFHGFPVKFAPPGIRRQDSVYNGLQEVDPHADWVCVHDAARPFITLEMVQELVKEASSINAIALAMPVKNTLKEVDDHKHVVETLDRSRIWEIQTPQLLKKEIIEAGFSHAHSHHLTVTDELSLVELIGHPAKLVRSSYQNIKITTPEDLAFAEWIALQRNIECASPTMEPTTVAGKSSPMAFPSKA